MVIRSYVGTAGSFNGPSRSGSGRYSRCCARRRGGRRRRGGSEVYRLGGRRYPRFSRKYGRRGGKQVGDLVLRANALASRNPDLANLRNRLVMSALNRI
jgi:hypothetical protein